ncbi:hypothetical protein GCM10025879_13260 [Leuconostoc litchii]|uniref:DUF536 domain-containing protein n=1 Tax=Leuconostoc litchii TaxID=1981069 RepID=A0A6P2CQ53_9LACO|nr:hypothetical protein [Leuconostoc litchii]TYC46350.1 hypothetical protein ESZ47_07710 [Leuconostoc litchii]GMA70080.1 hypothetical protein GCM10025879_13260 [Leuconostoc litchii]
MSENEKIEFQTLASILKKLDISKATYYRRAKAWNINPSQREFTPEELKNLDSMPESSDNDHSDVASESIKTLSEQLKTKDEQIKQLHKLLDQQQTLSLDLQHKIDVKEQQYLEVSDTSDFVSEIDDLKEALQKEKSKGIFKKIFGK